MAAGACRTALSSLEDLESSQYADLFAHYRQLTDRYFSRRIEDPLTFGDGCAAITSLQPANTPPPTADENHRAYRTTVRGAH